MLECLYHFNRQQSSAFFFSSQKAPKGHLGAHAHFLLNLGYNLAFCGLLRVDELLKIQMQDISVSPNPQTGQTKLMLCLPFRKTSQFGGKFINYLIFSVLLNNLLDIKPFVWDEMPEEYQHICVVRAFSRWVLLSGLTEGYLFCKIRAGDRIAEENEPMVSMPSLVYWLILKDH